MQIALIGHHRMTQIVADCIRKQWPQVQMRTLLMESDHLDAMDEQIRAVEPLVDGLLFTGQVPFDLMNQSVLSQKPWTYIKRDAAQLLVAMLTASRIHRWDIARMSVDSYPLAEVASICAQIGIPPQLPAVYPKKAYREGFLADLEWFHRQNIMTGKSQFCITGISSVYEKLQREGIPALILDPTEESIQDAMQLLMIKRESRLAEERQMVVIAVEQDLPDEHALIRENEYQMALEAMGMTEDVYLFAQRIQAAVVSRDLGKFLLFTTKNLLDAETDGFRRFDLLTSKTGKRFGSLSIGIGFGETAREAKYNANTAVLKAKKGGGNQAFLLSNLKTYGPLFASGHKETESRNTTDGRFQKAADKSGVSSNTILRLQNIMDYEQRDTFTAKELAHCTRMSVRSVNRLLDKLLMAGFANIVGSQMQEATGRPGRILKISFTTASS